MCLLPWFFITLSFLALLTLSSLVVLTLSSLALLTVSSLAVLTLPSCARTVGGLSDTHYDSETAVAN